MNPTLLISLTKFKNWSVQIFVSKIVIDRSWPEDKRLRRPIPGPGQTDIDVSSHNDMTFLANDLVDYIRIGEDDKGEDIESALSLDIGVDDPTEFGKIPLNVRFVDIIRQIVDK